MTVLELAGPVAWVATFQLGAWAVGRRALARLDARSAAERSALERTFLAGVLGFVVFAHLGVALSASGGLREAWLAAAVVGAAALGARDLAQLGALQRLLAFRPTLSHLPLALMAGVLIAKLPAALYPVLRHDDAAYHLALPKLYLAANGFVPLPFNHYANMPHAIEVLYAFAFAGGGFLAAKVLGLALAGWTLLGLGALVRPKLGVAGWGMAAVLYLVAPNVIWHLGLAYVEIALGLWLLAALCAVLSFERTRSRADAWLVGLFLGAALASKYTGWLFAAPIGLVAAALSLRPSAGGARQIRTAAEMAAIALASVAPWLVKNAMYTGNPIYPNLYNWFGGTNWSEAQALHLARSMAFAGGEEGGAASLLQLPLRLVVEPRLFFTEAFSGALVVLVLAAFGATVLFKSRRAELGTLAAIAFGGVLAWGFAVQQGRFLVAWAPVLVVLAAWGIAPLARQARTAGLLAAAILVSGSAQIRHAPGGESSREWDVFHVSFEELIARNRHYDVGEYLNETVPPGGKVLGLWENRLFFLNRTLHADTAWEAPQVLSALRLRDDAAGFAADLRADGFTHGVITHTAWKYFDNERMFDLIDDTVYPAAQLARDRELLETFLGVHTETVFEASGATVFRFR